MSLGISKLRMQTLVFCTLPEGHVKFSQALPHCGCVFMAVLKVADTSPEGMSASVLSAEGSKMASVRGAETLQLV